VAQRAAEAVEALLWARAAATSKAAERTEQLGHCGGSSEPAEGDRVQPGVAAGPARRHHAPHGAALVRR
jgi:hypothetical protein